MKLLIVFACLVAVTYTTFVGPVVPVQVPVPVPQFLADTVSNALAKGKRMGRSVHELKEPSVRSKRGAVVATSNAIAFGRIGRAASNPPAVNFLDRSRIRITVHNQSINNNNAGDVNSTNMNNNIDSSKSSSNSSSSNNNNKGDASPAPPVPRHDSNIQKAPNNPQKRQPRSAVKATSNAVAVGRIGRAAAMSHRGRRDETTATGGDKDVGWMDRAAKYLNQFKTIVKGAIKVLDIFKDSHSNDNGPTTGSSNPERKNL